MMMSKIPKRMRGVYLNGHGSFDMLEVRDVVPVPNLGADKVLMRSDSLVNKLGKNSIDVVIDLVGGKQWPDLLDVLKPFGRYAVAGAIGDPHVKLDIRMLYLKDLSLFGCTVLDESVFSNLVKYIENGNISPLIAATYPLEDIVKAQEAFLEKKHTGKIVLKVNRASEAVPQSPTLS